MNEPTNQIKSSERQNKGFAKTPIGPCLTLPNQNWNHQNGPHQRTLRPTATLIAQLDQHQLTAYNQLYTEYKDDLRVHQKRKQAT